MSPPIEFLVAGGGVGGLAAALALAQAGHRAHVIERAAEFGEIGAGIQLAPNATRVLDRLGVLEGLLEDAVLPDAVVLMDAVSGQPITSLNLGESYRARYGSPYIVMHRGDLHETLLGACRAHERVTLENGRHVTGVQDLEHGARVECADGSSFECEALVGADGVNSTVRTLLSDDELHTTGYVAYRGTIPIEQVERAEEGDVVLYWVGPEVHLVQYPVRRGELYNQVAVFRSPSYAEGAEGWGGPDELQARFEPLHPRVREARELLDQDRHWPMIDRAPIAGWTRNRITLLGDAAHPMVQYIAQGGCQALEDATALADAVERAAGDVPRAFTAYQDERAPRTARVQLAARAFGELCHADGITVALRNRLLGARADDDYADVDWLYVPQPQPAQA